MIEETLFPLPEACAPGPKSPTRREDARVVQPVRQQLQWLPRSLDDALTEDHPVRAIWAFLERLDLEAFYARIKAVTDRPGRPTTDPQVLLAVWVLGVVDSIGSARQLARLCQEHDAYRWLAGGVPINYHMLSDFRVDHGAAMDDLMSQVVGRLRAYGAVPGKRVAQDGIRVRASAGAGSFRRGETLASHLAEARADVVRLAEEREHPDPGVNKRQQAARERAARERVERVEQALASLPRAAAVKEAQIRHTSKARREKMTAPRISTTDADAHVMKMADGGFRPAFNVQFATDEGGVIVGVGVTDSGSDSGQALPMAEQVERRTGEKPRDYLMDGGFVARDDITTLARQGIDVYAPVRQPNTRPEAERYQPRWGDSAEVIEWRKRMATEEAKTVYRQRGAIAEWTNAQVTSHGLTRFTVRGMAKVTTVTVLIALTHNLLRWATLV